MKIQPKKNSFKFQDSRGQLMITTVLLLGGVVISAAALLSFLVIHKMKQATDIGESVKAIFASDAGREWELYRALQVSSSTRDNFPCPTFSNKAGFESFTYVTPIEDNNIALNIISVGQAPVNKSANNSHAWVWTWGLGPSSGATSTYTLDFPEEPIRTCD